MEETDRRERAGQSREQGLIGHLIAVCRDANQRFKLAEKSVHGIDGEIEFRDDAGKFIGRRVFVVLNSKFTLRRTLKGRDIVLQKSEADNVTYWMNQPFDTYLVLRLDSYNDGFDKGDNSDHIYWVNLTKYCRSKSLRIPFDAEKVNIEAIWRIRDTLFPREIGSENQAHINPWFTFPLAINRRRQTCRLRRQRVGLQFY
jgi:hypothetical protein